jgi:hypothetical protein
VNTTAAKEHTPEVEWRIYLIKEQGRGILNILLIKMMPQIMLIELIHHVILWLNQKCHDAIAMQDYLSTQTGLCKAVQSPIQYLL